jgi:hypothetical protein
MERWYTAREIAERIGMSTRFVQREAQIGHLRGRALGGGPRPALRFRADDVTSWLRAWSRERGRPGVADEE